MRIRDIFSGTVWYGVVPKLSTLAYIVILPLTTPYLTLFDFGIIGILTSYTALITSISSLGFHIHLPNSFYELKTHYKLFWRRETFYFLLFGFIFSVILYIILYFTIDDTGVYSKSIVFLLAAFPVIITASKQVSVNYCVLNKQPAKLVFINLIGSILGMVAFFICARILKLGYLSWLISTLVSSSCIFLLFIPIMWIKQKLYPVMDFSIRRFKRLLKISLPVVPHGLGHSLLASSDRVVLSLYSIETNQIGLYSTGSQMAMHIRSFVDGFHTAISPYMQTAYRENNIKEMRKLFFLSQVTISTGVFIVSLWMKEIFYFLIRNDDLRFSYIIASMVCFSFAALPFYTFLSLSVLVKKKTRHILWLVFFPGILSVSLNLIFIPIYGYLTTVAVAVISNWSLFFIPFIHSFYKQEVVFFLGKIQYIFIIILSNILLLLFVVFFSKTLIIYKLITTAVSCLIFFILSRKYFINR